MWKDCCAAVFILECGITDKKIFLPKNTDYLISLEKDLLLASFALCIVALIGCYQISCLIS